MVLAMYWFSFCYIGSVLAILPGVFYYGTGSYGTTNPAFWEFGNTNSYSEVDGFEFGNSPWQEGQTSHSGSASNQCGITVDPGSTDFSNGQPHAFYLITTPDEIDWFVDNSLTRSDTRFYVSAWSSTLFPPTPYYYNTSVPSNPFWYTPTVFPQQPWQLIVDDAIQPYNTPNPEYFPIDFHVQSIKYYEYFSNVCGGGFYSQVNVDQSMLIESSGLPASDPNANTFDVFVGETVNLNGPINLPLYKYPDQLPWLGQLKLIAENNVLISGSNTISGYFVAEANGNICNGDYNGPSPLNTSGSHKPIKTQNNNTGTSNTNRSIDSLNCYVKQSVTKGEFYVGLNNISQDELGQLANVTVYNMLGQTMFTGNIQVEENNEIPIDLSTKAKGVYIVIIRTKDQLLHKKIVLQ